MKTFQHARAGARFGIATAVIALAAVLAAYLLVSPNGLAIAFGHPLTWGVAILAGLGAGFLPRSWPPTRRAGLVAAAVAVPIVAVTIVYLLN